LAFCGVALFGLGPNNGKAGQVATRQSPRQGGQALGARKRWAGKGLLGGGQPAPIAGLTGEAGWTAEELTRDLIYHIHDQTDQTAEGSA
jgi:hypothetical protein